MLLKDIPWDIRLKYKKRNVIDMLKIPILDFDRNKAVMIKANKNIEIICLNISSPLNIDFNISFLSKIQYLLKESISPINNGAPNSRSPA